MQVSEFTLDALRQIMIDDIGVPENLVPEDPKIRVSTLVLDSLTIVQFGLLVKHKYGVELEDEAVESLDTIGDVVQFINKKLLN